MKSHPTALRKRGERAFTLVEVVLALAVSAIGLVAILGLLPQGLQASRDAADNTISATIVHDIFSTLRTTPYTNITNLDSFGFMPNLTQKLKGSAYTNLQTFPVTPPLVTLSNYLDQAGFYTTPYANGFYTNAYYKIVLTFQPEIPPGAPNTTPATVSIVTATVVWPAQAASPINTNVFVTKVAYYNQ
jgi:prepilin-type N-terminal cleavage/methylation domain-containing protein